MKLVKQKYLNGERALFQSDGMRIEDSVFADGESPLKESKNLEIDQSVFKWKYPLWYCQNVQITNSALLESARSGIWYTHHIRIQDSIIEAPKTFRRASDITLENVDMPLADQTFWNCQDIKLNKVTIRGDYFAMNSDHITADYLNLTGNYCFDGANHIVVRNSKLLSKDAFWNCENITVYDSTIIGEYLGWNSKNITFINCTIESLQGLCYMENVKLVNCKLMNTSLAFEYCSHIEAEITSHVDSIKNPISGMIRAQSIGEIILEESKINPADTKIVVENKNVNETPQAECLHC